MKKLDLHLIRSLEDFKTLEKSWNSLYDQSDRCTIFNSWDWMFTWWEVFQEKEKRELFIICLYQNRQLVGIAPFQIELSFPLSLLQGKTLRFIGSSSKNEIMTECSDLIVKKEFEKEFVSLISEFLVKNKKFWNFSDFEYIQEDSLILDCYPHSDKQVSIQKKQYGARYLISNMASFEDYQNQLSSRWNKAFKRKNNALKRNGESITEEIKSLQDIRPMFDRLADMHRERWQGKLDSCIFDMPEFKKFHIKVLERLVPKKKANIKTLKLNNEALSSLYIFEDKGQVHYYQSGFYTKHGNKYSPLFLLMCEQIGIASKNNKTFDLMFDENTDSYKKHQYAAKGKKMYRLKITHQPFRFILLNFAKKVIHIYRGTNE